ncbi:MAG TPA: hypothetical protein VFQ45_05135 [Longimicrobium sp.]|nr:hypothetical protein [Longimicrobium sp.]
MRKLKLDLEQLDVETFETEEPEAQTRGTVKAHDPTNLQARTCDPFRGTCFGFTCILTCICTGIANPATCGPLG